MSDWSYKKSNVEYRDSKQPHIEKEPKHKKKVKKKNKRSKHKHEYIPAVYHLSYVNFNDNKKNEHITCGSHCKHCGRVKNMHFIWSHEEERIQKFKKEYPNYVELTLPEGWDWFRNKNIPL